MRLVSLEELKRLSKLDAGQLRMLLSLEGVEMEMEDKDFLLIWDTALRTQHAEVVAAMLEDSLREAA
jgi:hypothetical protein